MAFIQQVKVTDMTYREFAINLLEKILAVGKMASRLDVVFDDYREVSIKNVERLRRASGPNLNFKQIGGSAVKTIWLLLVFK